MGSPSPQRSRSVYGFVLMVGSLMALFAYLAWAIVPTSRWARLGVIYVPDKYWALALPAWAVVAVLTFACCLYPGYVLICSKPNSSRGLVEDSVTDYSVPSRLAPKLEIEPLHDVRLSEMNRLLYRTRLETRNVQRSKNRTSRLS